MFDLSRAHSFTNLHKWAMAAGPVTALHATNEAMRTSHHVVPSWQADSGLLLESRWPGTRDFAAWLSVPDALAYLEEWRSIDGLSAQRFNAIGWQEAEAMLREAWDVEPATAEPDALSCIGMGMVRLPCALDLSGDQPGQPSAGVRARLRHEFGIEAAVGGFGEHGGFLRLSHAVYNVDEDFERLRDAVSTMARCGV